MIARFISYGLALLLVSPALAGDSAMLEILGFDKDGSVFAFEEYGIQDGSGFPYANRYYIDTDTDQFLPGSPIKIRLDDENASLEEAREKAKDQSISIRSDDELIKGFIAGWSPITELSANPHHMEIAPRPIFPPIDEPVQFRLEEFHMAAGDTCSAFGDIKGFRLLRVALAAEQKTTLMHEDQRIPSSRSCPLGYHLAGVTTFYPRDGTPLYAALIAVRSVGFEGPNHRYIAVTGKL